MNLAGEDAVSPRGARVWLRRVLVGLALVLLVATTVTAIKRLVSTDDAPKRQVAKISLLPDTPPPPPPPREEPKKEQPREAPKQQVEQPKPQEAPRPPADQPIKMEGAAGDGPSAFQSGAVTQDYKGGAPAVGASSPGGVADRAQERFYANNARQLLREEIERHLRPDAGELTSTFAVWVEADGRIRRFELVPSGEPSRDAHVQAALDGTTRELRLPPPGSLPQPMRFRLTLRSQA